MEFCNGCSSFERTIYDHVSGDIICWGCGHISSNDNIYDEIGTFNNTHLRLHDRAVKKKVSREQYITDYFNKVMGLYSDRKKLSLPQDILDEIYTFLESEEGAQYKERFIHNPSQKITQKIFRVIRISENTARKYKSNRTGLPLNDLTRTNFNMRWKDAASYMCDQYQIHNPYKMTISNDMSNIVCDVRKIIIQNYDGARRVMKEVYGMTRKDDIYKKAVPSVPTSFYVILLLLDPCLFMEYENMIAIPTDGTVYNNIDLIVFIMRYISTSILKFRENIIEYLLKKYKHNNHLLNDILRTDYMLSLDILKQDIKNRSVDDHTPFIGFIIAVNSEINM